jgi:hypothetical protein
MPTLQNSKIKKSKFASGERPGKKEKKITKHRQCSYHLALLTAARSSLRSLIAKRLRSPPKGFVWGVLKTGEKVLIQHEEHQQSSDTSEQGEWEDDNSEEDEVWNEEMESNGQRPSENAEMAFPLVMRPPGSSDSLEISQEDGNGGSDTSDSESQSNSDGGNPGKIRHIEKDII